MSFYDWMLAVHILAAFSWAAALVLYSVMVVAGRRADTLEQVRPIFRLAPLGTPLIAAGMVLTILLGIVMAIDSEDIQPWDLWVLAALVLWALAGWVGSRTGSYYTEVQKRAEAAGEGAEADVLARLRAPTGPRLHLALVGIFVLILLDMLFKPGA